METPPLDVVQRWLLDVIAHPGGVRAGIASPAAQREIPLTADRIEEVIGRSRECDSFARLAVYGNAYHARLIECLAAEFPAVRHAVGEEAFAAFVVEYLQRFPSRSYTLANLGRDFARFLYETRPAENARSGEPAWPDFLVDLARLERCYAEVFDGPGEEGETMLSAGDVQDWPADELDAIRLKTAESLRLCEFRFPVQDYVRRVRLGESPEVPDVRHTRLAIHRRDFIVRRHELNAAQWAILKTLQEGGSLESALNSALWVWDGELRDMSVAIHSWFRDWTAAGLFRGISRIV